MNVWLVGGDKVIPTSVEKAIEGDGYTVKRISGEDRYETAAAIAEAGIKLSGKKPSKVFVASGTSFADALAVSPVAFIKGYPIILTEKDSTSDFSKKELGNIGTDAKILVGGEAVVSKTVAANLSIKEEARVAGDDRAVTANKVADWAKQYEGFNPANAALVGGTNGNGADSLVAASLAGKSYTTLHFAGWDATNVYMKDHAADLTGKGFVFGGKAAVSDDQVGKAQSAAQYVVPVVSTTDAPELQSVKAGDKDGDNTAVKFSFDEDIAAGADESKFTLVDYAGNPSSVVAGTKITKDKDDPKSVWAVFATKNVDAAVAALVSGGAAKDLDANASIPGSAALNSVTVAGTEFGDLVKVTNVKGIGTSDASVDLVFDDTVSVPTAGKLAFVRASGDVVSLTLSSTNTTLEKTAKDKDTLRVDVSTVTKAQWDSFRRVSVEDVSTATQALQSLDLASSGVTDAPDISKVDINRDKDYVDVTFDTPVTVDATVAGQLALTSVDGTTIDSAVGSKLVTGSNTTVRFKFAADDLAEGDDFNVYATLAAEAVTGTASGKKSAVDGEAYTYTLKAGDTAGPNVTGAALTVSKGAFGKTAVTLTFDETVDSITGLSVIGYTASGKVVDLTTAAGAGQVIVTKDSKNTNQVSLTFPAGTAKDALEDGDIKLVSLNGETVVDVHGYTGYATSITLK